MFQTSAPLIHILYDEMNTLVVHLMRRCLKPEAIGDKSGKELLDKKENWLREVNIEWTAVKQLNNWLDDVNILVTDLKCSPRDTHMNRTC